MHLARWRYFKYLMVSLLISYFVPQAKANHKNFNYYLATNDSPSYGINRPEYTPVIAESKETAEKDESINYNLLEFVNEFHLERSSIVFGLIKVANASNVNSRCHFHLKNIERGVLRKDSWAIKVLDASGTKPPGFVFGQNFWLGSREGCGAVRRPLGITLSANFPRIMHNSLISEIAPFEVDYRVIYLKHNSPWQVELKVMSEQIVHIGLCLPSSCANSEIEKLMSTYVQQGPFVENDIFDIKPEVIYMKDLKINKSFYQRPSFKIFSACLIFTLTMTAMASFIRKKRSPKQTADEATCEQVIVLSSLPLSIPHFVSCFDIQENWSKLFTTKPENNSIAVIDGLRSMCAIWIMLFHVMWFMYFTVHNKPVLVSYAETGIFQYLSSAPILVDVFFTISGFLQVHNFLSNSRKLEAIRANNFWQNAKQFAKMLIRRYLRYPNLTKVSTVTALAGNVIWTYAVGLNVNFELSFDTFLATANYIYLSPFVRSLPYIMGAMGAWYLIEYRERLVTLSEAHISLRWNLAILVFFTCLFSTAKRDLSSLGAVTLIVFGRLCLSAAICWTVIGSATGRACWWSQLLEAKLFQHLNKLSYAIYLLNPLVIVLLFSLTSASIHADLIMMIDSGFNCGDDLRIDVINSTLNRLYVKPWLRVFPYIGGATMGWVMHYLQQRKHLNSAQCSQCDKLQQQQQQQQQQHHQQQKQQQQQRKKNFFFKEPRKWFSYVYLTFWLFLAVFYLITNFMSYWRTMPTWLLATIMTVGKLAFSLCIGVVIIMCASGRGGRLNAFLSARPFLFLNKFCFSIYLMAPVIVMGIFGLRNAPTNYTDVSSGADFFATIILALMSGFLVLLLLELPTQKLAILMRRHFNT
uniref:Nose resistant-to-fluoxetine protein N-terminal domain-containing protein n=1 Tax=Glossina austeni TaxID=7395 RepID=A0A1A9USB3_GLOAU